MAWEIMKKTLCVISTMYADGLALLGARIVMIDFMPGIIRDLKFWIWIPIILIELQDKQVSNIFILLVTVSNKYKLIKSLYI